MISLNNHRLTVILAFHPLSEEPIPPKVGAAEALQMGLVNRVVPTGTAREAAEQLARDLAQFPQICLRNDRLSAYEQFDISFADAMANEFRRGLGSLQAGVREGATRFAEGRGRHGSFDEV